MKRKRSAIKESWSHLHSKWQTSEIKQFTYFGNTVSSIESHVDICLAKVRTAINRVLIILKSDLSDKVKQDFFQAVTVSILLYGCATWMLTKCVEKKLDGDYIML